MYYIKTPWCPPQIAGLVWTPELFPCHREVMQTAASHIYESVIDYTRVIIKRYSKALKGHFRPYIIHEVDIHSRLHHENVVTLYGVFETPDYVYFVMEPCVIDLRDYLNTLMDRNQYPVKEEKLVKEILIPILRGISYLHSTKIIHRDIKPENILLDSGGRWKLCDFGVSINLVMQRPSSMVGTLDYMAPDVVSKNMLMNDGEKIDIWSFGIMACECLTGTLLFQLKENDKIQLYTNIDAVSEQLKTVLPSALDKTQRDFIECCLRTDTNKRWSARELLHHPFIRRYQTGMEAESAAHHHFRCGQGVKTKTYDNESSGNDSTQDMISGGSSGSGSGRSGKLRSSIRSLFMRSLKKSVGNGGFSA